MDYDLSDSNDIHSRSISESLPRSSETQIQLVNIGGMEDPTSDYLQQKIVHLAWFGWVPIEDRDEFVLQATRYEVWRQHVLRMKGDDAELFSSLLFEVSTFVE